MNKKQVNILTGIIVLLGCAYLFKLDGYKFNIIVMIIAIKGMINIWKGFDVETKTN